MMSFPEKKYTEINVVHHTALEPESHFYPRIGARKGGS